MQLTKNFHLNEFQSKDGAKMPAHCFANVAVIAVMLQAVRDYFNLPIIVTSGYRSKQHNKDVGGMENSHHLTGKAVDFKVYGIPPIEVQRALNLLMLQGKILQGGLGVYPSFIHYDIRGHYNLFKY